MNYTFSLLPPNESRCVPIVPVFMPFAGCPFRCVFCAQDRQTGQGVESPDALLSRLSATLAERQAAGRTPVDVAFYGGTFTCLPEALQQRCLAVTEHWRHLGVVQRVRASTRPDSLSEVLLSRLQDWGLHRLELGIQSFCSATLAASQRGYNGDDAVRGCALVQESGLELGIQLLPGMPGSTPEIFLNDVAVSLTCNPACLRFYPCLVLEGTPLAALWRQGRYAPWTLPQTIETLGLGLASAWAAGVAVIRLSLAPEPSLEAALLAGPRHEALGSLIQAEALWQRLSPWLQDLPKPVRLRVPGYCQGFFFGHKKSLAPRWAERGVTSVEWKVPGTTPDAFDIEALAGGQCDES